MLNKSIWIVPFFWSFKDDLHRVPESWLCFWLWMVRGDAKSLICITHVTQMLGVICQPGLSCRARVVLKGKELDTVLSLFPPAHNGEPCKSSTPPAWPACPATTMRLEREGWWWRDGPVVGCDIRHRPFSYPLSLVSLCFILELEMLSQSSPGWLGSCGTTVIPLWSLSQEWDASVSPLHTAMNEFGCNDHSPFSNAVRLTLHMSVEFGEPACWSGERIDCADAPILDALWKRESVHALPLSTCNHRQPTRPYTSVQSPWTFSKRALMCRFHQRRGGLQYGASGPLGEYECWLSMHSGFWNSEEVSE